MAMIVKQGIVTEESVQDVGMVAIVELVATAIMEVASTVEVEATAAGVDTYY